MTNSWPTMEMKESLGLLDEWAPLLRSVLSQAGVSATLAVLLFNRQTPIHAFPVPQFSLADQSHLIGLLPFTVSQDGSENPYSFNPMHHLLPLEVAGGRVLLMAVVGRDLDGLRHYIEHWCERAKAQRECAPLIDNLYVVYVAPELYA